LMIRGCASNGGVAAIKKEAADGKPEAYRRVLRHSRSIWVREPVAHAPGFMLTCAPRTVLVKHRKRRSRLRRIYLEVLDFGREANVIAKDCN